MSGKDERMNTFKALADRAADALGFLLEWGFRAATAFSCVFVVGVVVGVMAGWIDTRTAAERAVDEVQGLVDDAFRPWLPAGEGDGVALSSVCEDGDEAGVPRPPRPSISAVAPVWSDICDWEEAVVRWAFAHAPRVDFGVGLEDGGVEWVGDRGWLLWPGMDEDLPWRSGDVEFKRANGGIRLVSDGRLRWYVEAPGAGAERCPPTSRSLSEGTMVVMDGRVVCLTLRVARSKTWEERGR